VCMNVCSQSSIMFMFFACGFSNECFTTACNACGRMMRENVYIDVHEHLLFNMMRRISKDAVDLNRLPGS
jgi:hypothetical protein